MDEKNKKPLMIAIVVIVAIVLFIFVVFVILYASGNLFNADETPFKSGFSTREEKVAHLDPLIVLKSDVDRLINMFETQTNLDSQAAYQAMEAFLKNSSGDTPIDVINAVTIIKNDILRDPTSIGYNSNENQKFITQLYNLKELLKNILDSAILLANQKNGTNPKFKKLVEQRIISDADNETLKWINTFTNGNQEEDLKEFALEIIGGANRNIGEFAADDYENLISNNKDIIGDSAKAYGYSPNNKSCNKNNGQIPYPGAKSNKGSIPDMTYNDVPHNEFKDRPHSTNIGLINHIARDYDQYNPFPDTKYRGY